MHFLLFLSFLLYFHYTLSIKKRKAVLKKNNIPQKKQIENLANNVFLMNIIYSQPLLSSLSNNFLNFL